MCHPQLSVVVVIASDTTDRRCDLALLAGTLAALHAQISPPSLEIIVPYHPEIQRIENLKSIYPDVIFKPVTDVSIKAGSREHHDELRARGVGDARGQVIALLEDHACPDPDWARNVWEEHRKSFAVITGAIENGIDRPLNWAAYFCDFFRYQNPLPEGETHFASSANSSYKRAALERLRPIPFDVFAETTVNRALLQQGERIGLSSRIIVRLQRKNLVSATALKEFFIWGRSYGAERSRMVGVKRWALALLTPLLPGLKVVRMARTTFSRRRLSGAFMRAFPVVCLLCLCWSAGELTGYLTGSAGGNRSSA